MTPTQNLYYALGQAAYAIALADGRLQKEEKQKFHDLILGELENQHYDFDISDIIFQVMEKDHTDAETAYKWAIDQVRLNSHYLSPLLKKKFIRVMEKIAASYPPVTIGEQKLIDKFKKDIAPLEGDPVFYEKVA